MAQMHAVVELINRGDLVFDVGAHVGDKAIWFLNRGAKVICIEPQPLIAQRLHQRMAGVNNAIVVQKGLGRRRAVMNMSLCTSTPVLSTFSDRWKQGRFVEKVWDQTALVEIVTLDDLIAQYGSPKYCKIDVEGYEREVLAGLTAKTGCLSFEFTAEFIDDASASLDHLTEIGYSRFNLSLG